MVLESEWSLFRLWWGSRWLSTESLPIWTIYGRSVPRIMWFNRYSSSFHSFQKLCRELALAVLDWEHLPWFSHIFWNISIDNSIMPMNTIKSKQVKVGCKLRDIQIYWSRQKKGHNINQADTFWTHLIELVNNLIRDFNLSASRHLEPLHLLYMKVPVLQTARTTELFTWRCRLKVLVMQSCSFFFPAPMFGSLQFCVVGCFQPINFFSVQIISTRFSSYLMVLNKIMELRMAEIANSAFF